MQTSLYVYNQELYDPTIIQHLITAKQRGVDVHVLVAGTAGHSTTPNAKNLKAVQQLQAAGITAQPFNRLYLHTKAIVADNSQVFLGSQNFSSGGLMNNREVGEIINDQNIVNQVTQIFKADEADPGTMPTATTPDPSNG